MQIYLHSLMIADDIYVLLIVRKVAHPTTKHCTNVISILTLSINWFKCNYLLNSFLLIIFMYAYRWPVSIMGKGIHSPVFTGLTGQCIINKSWQWNNNMTGQNQYVLVVTISMFIFKIWNRHNHTPRHLTGLAPF